MKVETVAIASLTLDPTNARIHNARNLEAIKGSLARFGQQKTIVVSKNNVVVAGNGTLEAARALGWETIDVQRTELDSAEAMAYALADNRPGDLATWDEEILSATIKSLNELNFDMGALGFDEDFMAALAPPEAGEGGSDAGPGPSLADRFLVPPFSVLDARQGYWQDRKRAWLAMGIESEAGRGGNLLSFSAACDLPLGGKPPPSKYGKCLDTGIGENYGREEMNATSIFDPVLCELAYRWFAPKDGAVLDPFAGGSVRGIVAAKLGLSYVGHELSAKQVAANEAQAKAMDIAPVYICGDSSQTLKRHKPGSFDLVFSCPPYADLEVYSADPNDLSNMPYPDFITAYRAIIVEALKVLKNDRFAVWVVGEVREKGGQGFYRGLVPDTIKAFEAAGAQFYNEAILVTAVGSLPVRSGRIFAASRKVGKTHQNVLVFCKGDPRRATEACGEVEVADLDPASNFGEVIAG